MGMLPILLDAEEAIDYYNSKECQTDAAKAFAIGVLSNEGYSNQAIRDVLGIAKIYTATHFIRAGTLLSEDELNLWHNNPTRITLGHVRATAKLNRVQREELLRKLLVNKRSVAEYEQIAKGEELKDVNIKSYEKDMAEKLGRKVNITYNSQKKTGTLTLDFYMLDDLEEMAKRLGYSGPEE